jgi:biopolymer transport protein ExbD
MAHAAQDRPLATINITPLVDVLLVMLVIFMVAAPLLSRPLPMQLPQHGNPATATPLEVRLQIDSAGDYTLDGRPVSASALGDALQAALQQAPDLRLRIASADDSDYQAFVGALSVAERVGIRNIGSETR